jgi:uncharacterized membrane protein
MTPEEARRQPLAQQRSPRVSVCTLGWRDPLRWLAAGARDMRACPALSLGFGALFTAVAWLLGLSLRSSPQYALLLASGLMLLGPALAMGLIQASRSCEAGQRPRLRPCLLCWWPARSSVALFAGLLLVLELLWARSALIVFALFADSMAPEPSVAGLLLDPANRPFLAAYGAIGALFAGFAFACSVIAVPMLLDRPVDAITAALSSLRACLEHPWVLLLWGALLTLLTLLALLPAGLGLLLVGPLLGHASWHAYRGIVCPAQPQPELQPRPH